MYKLNSIFPSSKITIVVLLLTTMITILGCGDSSTDTTSDKSEYDINYENKDLSVKSITEDVSNSNIDIAPLDSTPKAQDTINTNEQTISLESDNYSKQLEIIEIDTDNKLSLVFLYSDYWIGCTKAKPIVDQLENELNPEIEIKRVDILTEFGNEFSNEYSISTPGFILLNNSNEELLRFRGVPNKTQFVERLKEYI